MAKITKAVRERVVRYEVEFVDMEHTLEWLLETAEKYNCDEAVKHLKMAEKLIKQKRSLIFD